MSARAFTATALLLAVGGCDRSPPSDAPGAPPPNVLAPAAPVDHLATGELVEGPENAFGLALPRGIRVDGAFVDAIYASGFVPLHPMVQYFRARLRGGDMREGETAATFEHVVVAGQPGRDLRIHVTNVGVQVRIEIQDTTPPPTPNLPDEKSRWKQVGLTPEGRLADPTHLE